MTKAEIYVCMAVLMIGGVIVCGLIVNSDPSSLVRLFVGVGIAIGSLAAAIKLGMKKPTDGDGSADET